MEISYKGNDFIQYTYTNKQTEHVLKLSYNYYELNNETRKNKKKKENWPEGKPKAFVTKKENNNLKKREKKEHRTKKHKRNGRVVRRIAILK